jgi:hypothetical protein
MPEGNAASYLGVIVILGIVGFLIVFMAIFSGSTYQVIEPLINDLEITNTKINFTFTASNTSMVSLGNKNLINGTLTIQNKTLKLPNVNVNYTVNYINGSLKLKAGGMNGRMQNGKKYNATYTYDNLTLEARAKSTIEKSIDANGTAGTYMPIIVMAILSFMVISAFVSLGFVKGRGGSNDGVL